LLHCRIILVEVKSSRLSMFMRLAVGFEGFLVFRFGRVVKDRCIVRGVFVW